jgi:hypothetical protein
MRPQSEIRVTLAAALVDGGGTTKQLAQRTGWSIGLTRRALDNMVTAGDVRKPRSVRVPGVKRPVPVYERAVRPSDAAACGVGPGVDLIMAWAGLAVPAERQHAGAAM